MALVQYRSDFFDFINRPRTILAWDTAYPEKSVQIVTTIYDETHAGIWHDKLQILSTGYGANLIAHLEHHDPNTDGHFDIQITRGDRNFISQPLYNSIPDEHRPQMMARSQELTFINGVKGNTLGQVFVPILLTNAKNGKGFCIVLHAYVMEGMTQIGMITSYPSWIRKTWYKEDGWEHVCKVVLKEPQRWRLTAGIVPYRRRRED